MNLEFMEASRLWNNSACWPGKDVEAEGGGFCLA